MDVLAGREIIFEFRVSGGFAQVSAIDCATGIEVCVTTPANAHRADQQALALRKLAKSLIDQNEIVPVTHNAKNDDTTVGQPPIPKKGLLA